MTRASTPPVNRKITVAKSSIKGLIDFGAGHNLLPQLAAEILESSVTGRRCHSVRSKFIQGNGFKNPELAKRVIHRSGLTMDKLLAFTASNMSSWNVDSYHVNFNGLGQIVGIRPVSVPIVRFLEPGEDGVIKKAALCNYLNSTLYPKRAKEKTEVYLFNPDPNVVLEQIREAGGINSYNGQLIYNFTPSESDEYYHNWDWMPCIKDLETDAGLSVSDHSAVQNGLNISGVFGYIGTQEGAEVDGKAYDPNYDTTSLSYQMAKLQGPTKTGVVFTIEARTKEELESMKFIPLTGVDLDDRYNSTTARVENRIARSMSVPPPLIGMTRQGTLFATADELRVCSEYMQSIVNDWQRQTSETLSTVLRHWEGANPNEEVDCTIENLSYFTNASGQTVKAQQAN